LEGSSADIFEEKGVVEQMSYGPIVAEDEPDSWVCRVVLKQRCAAKERFNSNGIAIGVGAGGRDNLKVRGEKPGLREESL
jgi:hypothetical protein